MTERLDEPVRVGIIGLGDFGLFCLEAFAGVPELSVVACADPRPDLSLRTSKIPETGRYADWRDLMSDPSVEVVHIATPPWTHAEIALAAAESGKSALVEKPLALDLVDADRLITAYATRSTILGINYVMRHSPIYRFLIDVCRVGLLGSTRRISLDNGAQAVATGHWFWDISKSGGILVEHGVHFFDVFRQIAGEAKPVRTIDEKVRILAETEYASGCWGSAYHDFSLDTRVEHTSVAFVFEKGTAEIAGWIPQSLDLRAISAGEQDAWNMVLKRHPAAVARFDDSDVTVTIRIANRRTAYLDAIGEGMSEVARAHRNPESAPEVTPADARASLALALDAQRIAVRLL